MSDSRDPSSSASPAPPPGPSLADNLLRRRANGLSERLENVLCGLPFLASGALFSIALLAWALIYQLPNCTETRVVAAREEFSDISQRLQEAQNLASVDQTQLSNQLTAALEYVIPRKDRIYTMVSDIEKAARQLGWRAEVSVKPSTDRLSPSEIVNVYPASVRLVALPVSDPPPYQRLISLVERIEEMPLKVEVVSLSVADDRGALAVPQFELQFWTRKSDEKPSTK